MNKLIVIALLVIISGCASTSQIMVNEQGVEQECSAFGWGVLGTTAALVSQSNCEDRMRQNGYVNKEDAEKVFGELPRSIGGIEVIKELKSYGYNHPQWSDSHKTYILINNKYDELPSGELLVKMALVYKTARLLEDDITNSGKKHYISYMITTSKVNVDKNTYQTQTIEYLNAKHKVKMTGDHSTEDEHKFSIESHMGRALSLYERI